MKKLLALLLLLAVSAQAQVVETSSGNKVLTASGIPLTVNTTSTGIVATSSYIPNAVSVAASTAMMTRKCHYARAPISSLQTIMPCWAVDTVTSGYIAGERLVGNSCAINEWIEYPLGTYNAVLFSGSANLVAADQTNVVSDSLSINIPRNALFCEFTHITGSGGNNFPYYLGITNGNPLYVSGSSYEGSNLGTSVISSPALMTDDHQGKRVYSAAAIIGSTTRPSGCLLGDSVQAGDKETADKTFDLGDTARAIGSSTAYTNMGVGGDTLVGFYTHSTDRMDLITKSGCTFIIDQYAKNEFLNQAMAATNVEAYKASMEARFSGKNYWATTLEPGSTSSDSWATVSGQTATSWDASATTYNDWVRAQSPTIPFIDLSDAASSSRDSGLWKGGKITVDGVHYQNNYPLWFTPPYINPEAIGKSVAISTTYPSVNATGSGVSYGTGYFSSTQAVTAGSVTMANGIMPGAPPYATTCWFKSSGNNINGCVGLWRLNIASGTGYAATGGPGGNVVNSTTVVNDGNWHYFEVDAAQGSSNNIYLFIDGNLLTTGSASWSQSQQGNEITPPNIVGTLGSYSFSMAEYAQWNAVLHTTNYTPPTNPWTGNEANLVVVCHLNGNTNCTRGSGGQ